jgi:hypothetical protein
MPLAPKVVLVSIKNSMPLRDGYAFFTHGIAAYATPEGSHVNELYSTISRFFSDALLADGHPQLDLI